MAFYSQFGQPASFAHNPCPPASFRPTPMSSSPPGQMDTSAYLPPYLLGSPAPKSPSRSRAATFQASTGVASGLQRGARSSMTTTPGGRGTSLIDHSHLGVGNAKVDAVKPAGGPPVQGLYDNSSSPTHTSTPLLTASPERRQLSFSVISTAGRGGAGFGTPGTSGLPTGITPGTVGVDTSLSGVRRERTPPSPAQMDPFYTQGEMLSSEDSYHDCWITVFGFPPAASSYILEQFSQYGTILKHKISSNGNWMHLLYQSRLQAKKALSKNGKVFGNGIMVGVQSCIDKEVMEDGTATAALSPLGESGYTPGKKPTSIRPLTAAYQASGSSHQVVPSNPNAPQKSTGFFSKALEYMFGW